MRLSVLALPAFSLAFAPAPFARKPLLNQNPIENRSRDKPIPSIPRCLYSGFQSGFGLAPFYDGQDREYIPDFLIRLEVKEPCHLILETKGYDPLEEPKRAEAERWVAAVYAEGSYGRWRYALVKDTAQTGPALDAAQLALPCPSRLPF